MRRFAVGTLVAASLMASCSADPDGPVLDPTRVLVNESRDLQAVLQTDQGQAACTAYLGAPEGSEGRSPENKLLCGKYLFFYESFGTDGLPLKLAQWMMQHFPENFGQGMSKFNMIPNPADPDGMPVGLARGPAPKGDYDVAAFTCGSCHFGQTEDGRYVVGMPNLNYEYGKQFVAFIGVAKMLLDPDSVEVIDAVKMRLGPEVDKVRNDDAAMAELIAIVSEFGTDTGVEISLEVQSQYDSWLPGTMDFLIPPILDDEVHTVSRILPLWSLPSYDEAIAAGMPHQMLSWTGLTQTLAGFVRGFALLSYGGDDVSDLAEPLEAYIATLKPPAIAADRLDAAAVERGTALFASAGCSDCHNGPNYGSIRTYPFDEIGTDDAMAQIFNPAADGTLCCGFSDGGDMATKEIKSPPLTGIWAFNKFLHNGSVAGLDALFCLEGPRPANDVAIYSDRGHDYTCDPALSDGDRRDLIAFLQSL